MKKIIALLLAVMVLSATALASDRYDLDDFGYRTVKTRGRGNLVFQSKPGGRSCRSIPSATAIASS